MDSIVKIENMELEKQINHNGNGDDHLLNISFITEDNHKTIKWKAKVLLPFCKSGVTLTRNCCGNSLINFGFGDLPCVEDPKYEIIKEKKQDMTLEEIEERLGYKIRIVSDDK